MGASNLASGEGHGVKFRALARTRRLGYSRGRIVQSLCSTDVGAELFSVTRNVTSNKGSGKANATTKSAAPFPSSSVVITSAGNPWAWSGNVRKAAGGGTRVDHGAMASPR